MSKNKTRTKDKYRVVYNDTQRIELENEFRLNEYIAIPRKQEIASKLQLSERQIKIWFQNRRAKKRKQQKRKQSGVVSTTSVTNGCSTTANSSPISTSSSVAPHQIISGATTTITPIASQHHHLGNLANSNNQHIISSTAHSAQVTSSSFIAQQQQQQQQQHESQHYQQKTLTNNLEHLNTVAQRHYQPQDHYQSLAHRQHAYQMMGHPNHSQHHHNGNSLSLLAASAQSHLGNKQMRPLASHSTSLVSSPETLSNNSNTTNEPVTGTNGDASAARLPSTSPSNADANTKRESISSADSSSSSSTYQQQQQEQVQRIQTSNNNNNYNNHHHHQPPHSLYANTSFYGQTVTATHQRHNSQPHYSFDRAHQEYYATVFNQQQQQLGNDQMVANSEANMTSASWLPQASHHDPSSVSPVVQLPADQHLNHNHHQHLQHRQQFHNHSHLNQQVQNPPQAGLAEQHTALAGAALQAPSDSSSAALAAAISTSPYLATNASYATNGYASHNHQPLAQQISNGSNNNNYPQPSIQHQNHIHPHHHNQHHLHSHHHQHHRQLIDYATMAASVNNNSHQTPAATTTQSLSPNVTRATCSPMQTNTTTTAINEQTQLITDDSYHYNATAAADAAMLTNVIHGGNLKGKHAIHY